MKMKWQERPSHSNRMPERWFRRALWLVAVVFAAFLIGLGGKIVGELPTVSQYKELHDYIDRNRFDPLEKERETLAKQQNALAEAMEQASLALDKQQTQTRKEQERFDNWLAARAVTEQSSQNPEVIRQTRALDELKDKEQQLQQKIDALNQQQLDGNQRLGRIQTQIDLLEQQAQELKTADDHRIELKAFLYRLALTLPLLAAAGYLFAKQRQSRWWPFVWGFIYFALFAFFCRACALSAQLRRVCPLHRRHHYYRIGRPLRHYGHEPLSRTQKSRRGPAQQSAPAANELRCRPIAHQQKHLPRLRAPAQLPAARYGLLPTLRHQPV